MNRPTSRPAAALLVGLGTALSGCASAGVVPEAPAPLAYGVPADSSVVYVQADSSTLSVDAGGETVEVHLASRGTLDLRFSPAAAAAVEVSALWTDFEARASNPLGEPETASIDDIEGPLVFTLTRTGRGRLVRAPELSGGARTFLHPDLVASTFFPRVPAQVVAPGDQWTDTIHAETRDGELRVGTTAVVTYRVVGDTVIGGALLRRIELDGTEERTVETSQGGMEVTQEVAGTRSGYVLWHVERGLPAEVSYETRQTGTMEVSSAPFPLGVKVDSRTHVRLLEPPAGDPADPTGSAGR